jgi:nucleoid-associated protein YgaU
LEMTRVAPPLPDPVTPPEPTIRNGAPQESPQPGEPTPAVTPATPNAIPKEYIVRKGDTLGHIAKVVYGTGSVRVTEFLIKANNIKNKHMVAEGQKLVVPQLPPDVFEPVQGLNVAQMDAEKVQKMDELINRRAPIKPEPAPDKPTETVATKPAKESTRVYEVRAKETFSSIAREQLGSESFWRDIQRLNKGVDPAKMRPGTKLKLPARRPLSDAAASGRSSA